MNFFTNFLVILLILQLTGSEKSPKQFHKPSRNYQRPSASSSQVSSSTLLQPVIIHHNKNKNNTPPTSQNSNKDSNYHVNSYIYYNNGTSSTGSKSGGGGGKKVYGATCQGSCIPRKFCKYHGGIVQEEEGSNPLCDKEEGEVCCDFGPHPSSSCGSSTKDPLSYFRSPNFPQKNNQSLDCSYEVYPAEGTCALRVDFLSFKLRRAYHSSKTESCISDALYVLNTDLGFNEPLCEMENHTAIIQVKKPEGSLTTTTPVKFVIIAQSQEFHWNLRITQVNCSKLQPWKNEPKCGRQFIFSPNKNETKDNSVTPEETTSASVEEPLIVNGEDALKREFPWQVSIQKRGKVHRCGGSIINRKYILTAAHCLMRNAYEAKSKIKVILGDYLLNSEEEEEFEVDQVISHFHYKPHNSHVNDIALLKVKGEISFSQGAQPICLPVAKGDEELTKFGWVSGWGRLNGSDSSRPAPTTLQKLKVNIINDTECRALVKEEFEHIFHRNVSTGELQNVAKLGQSRTQLCARAPLASAVCYGDSGGPLVSPRPQGDGSYMQIGIVSYGLGKCITERNPPSAYTRVSEFLQFISIATKDQEDLL